MEVTDTLIDKLATLARLHIPEEDRESLKEDLQKMIHFVQQLELVNTDAVEPLIHMSEHNNAFRLDKVGGSCSPAEALRNATSHNNAFFLVPKIIQKQ